MTPRAPTIRFVRLLLIALVATVGFALASLESLDRQTFGDTPVGDVEPIKSGEAEPATQPTTQFTRQIAPFLVEYCVECHGADEPRADFQVHDIDGSFAGGADLVRWEKIVEMVSLGDMPPAEASQPDRAERDEFVAWISSELEAAGRGVNPLSMQLPSYGNRVNHEDLFSGEFTGPAFSYSRLWRIHPEIYRERANLFRVNGDAVIRMRSSLTELAGGGFRDFSIIRADEATFNALLTDSKSIAKTLTVGPGSPPDQRRASLRGVPLLQAEEITEELIDDAVKQAFHKLLEREPTEEELRRYGQFLEESIAAADNLRGYQNLLVAILVSGEFVFRMELGLGEELEDGRRMLSPRELAYALSYAITDRAPDSDLQRAVTEGRLSGREDAEREIRRLLDTPDDRRFWSYPMYHRWESTKNGHNPRLLRFFQEFFGYTAAEDVFKDEVHVAGRRHDPRRLARDADILILHILQQDRHVFEELLTTDRYIVSYMDPERARNQFQEVLTDPNHRNRGWLDRLEAGRNPNPVGYSGQYIQAYNYDDHTWSWPIEQPFVQQAPRAGLLTHPAWLVAWSGNFDTDPIRRGKWIRERLLADSVPELPIGVDANLPEDPHRTMRERLEVTRADTCWRCHRQMNPLGVAFEAYDDFGAYREEIVLGDADSYERERRSYVGRVRRIEQEIAEWTDFESLQARRIAQLDQQLQNHQPPEQGIANYEERLRRYEEQRQRWLDEREHWRHRAIDGRDDLIAARQRQLSELPVPVPETKPVDDAGVLTGTGDPELDGPYEDAIDLMHRLARSDRVRQSIIRHMFRYWMGRNEMLSDSPTLMAMDQAYLDSNGSFKETLVALLTSDSFLYRRDKD